MSIAFQLLINGIIAGGIYALVASGFSLIYSTNKLVHFAHGGVIAFTAYVLYLLFNVLDLNFVFSVILAILFASLLGYAINILVYKQLRKKRASSAIMLIASIALLIFLESLILLIFKADIKTIGFINTTTGIELGGALITPLQIIIIVSSLVLLGSLFFFMKKTMLGKALRAVSDNKDVAEIIGISSEKIYSLSFIIGSAIAGTAAILISLEQNLTPFMGTGLIIKGFAAAVIGGLGSVPGAILGAFLLGITENFGIWYLPSGYKDAIAFVLLIIFLLFRPNGILGIKNRN
ncbi:branched-chain amino acid ABC transporter permease [Patescibacteria group bacterium]